MAKTDFYDFGCVSAIATIIFTLCIQSEFTPISDLCSFLAVVCATLTGCLFAQASKTSHKMHKHMKKRGFLHATCLLNDTHHFRA